MKTLSRTLAVIAILWAILSPPIFHVLASAHGRDLPWRLRITARDLGTTLPQKPASETAIISLPAQRVSNSVKMLDGFAEDIEQRSAIYAGETVISSVAIIILSVCILSACKRDVNTAA